MDEQRRQDERAAAAGDPSAKKRLFVARLRAGEVDPNAAMLAAILGREEAFEAVGSPHESFVPGVSVDPRRIFDLKPGDRLGHGPAFQCLTLLGSRLCAMWALDTALRAIQTDPNADRPRDMLLIQSLLDWIFDDSDENLRVVERSRQVIELSDYGGPEIEDTRARVMIHALSVPSAWEGPSADSAAAAVMTAVEAGSLAYHVALDEAGLDLGEAAAEAAERAEWLLQRVNLAKIALLEDQAHDDEGRPRPISSNPQRNSDADLRTLERQVIGVIGREEVDEDETSPELARLLKVYARTEGTLFRAGDRLLLLVVESMGLDVAAVGAAHAELLRLDRLRPRPDEKVIEPVRETFRRLDRELQREMKKAVGITSATVAAVEQESGVQSPDLDLFHCVHADVGRFNRHGPAYPWVRPRDFQVINITDLASATEAPAGFIRIEQGGYWTGFLREATRHHGRGDPSVLTAAVENSARNSVVSSTWLLLQVKLAAEVLESYSGFEREQTENTLLIPRRGQHGDPDEFAQDWNCQNVEVWGRTLVGAWRHVTGEGAVGAVLVVERRDLLLRTVGRGAVLSNRVGDELYRWLERQPTLPEAIADLERQGLIQIGR